MSMLIEKVINSHEVLDKISEGDKNDSLALSFPARMKLALNLVKTAPIYAEFIKNKNELIVKLGAKVEGEEGKYKINVGTEAFNTFVTEVTAASKQESGLDRLLVFSQKDLDGSKIKSDVLVSLVVLGLLENEEPS